MQNQDKDITSTAGDTMPEFLNSKRFWKWTTVVGLIALSFIAYITTLNAQPLWDEQLILSWINNLNSSAAFNQFIIWSGPTPALDAWQPITNLTFLYCQKFGHQSIWLYRFASVKAHALATVLLFFVIRKLPIESSFRIAVAACILFALYPLHAEAVSWLGGWGIELGVFYFLASLYCYLRSKSFQMTKESPRTNPTSFVLLVRWRWLVGGLFLYLVSLSSNSAMWIGAVLISLLEFTNWLMKKDNNDIKSLRRTLACALPFVIMSATYALAGGAFANQIPKHMAQLFTGHWHQPLLHMLLPINKTLLGASASATKEYIFLGVMLVPSLLIAPLAFLRSANFRYLLVLSLVWLAACILPYIGTASSNINFWGSHALYLASVPLCLLAATLLMGFSSCFLAKSTNLNYAGMAVSTLFLIGTSIFYWHHLWLAQSNYKGIAADLIAIEKSVQVVASRNQVPFVIASGISPTQAVDRSFSTDGAICIDSGTQLLSAPSVPDGRLKDALRNGMYRNAVFHWDQNFHSLIDLDLSPAQNEFGTDLDGKGLVEKLLPPLQYYRTITFDAQENALVLESNSTNGAAVRMHGDGLSPLAGDFLYLDAKIVCPGQQPGPNQAGPQEAPPQIELYWATRSCPEYDHKWRRSTTSALTNDNQYHRYFLSLRSLGWTTNGPIANIMLGFPAGAKVWLKGGGIADGANLIPKLSVNVSTKPEKNAYTYPFFNYPESAELGFASLSGTAQATLQYDLSNIKDATGGFVEISQPNRQFLNPNGNEFSESQWKKVPLNALSGPINFRLQDFPSSGVYSIRVIASDAAGHVLGNFSDEIKLNVSGK
jgi:hypothetical protein